MRKPLTGPYRTNKGDLVVITMRLRRTQSVARLSLWSAVEGDSLSPHVQHDVTGVMIQGRPQMHQPVYMRLSSHVKKASWKFIADEDLTFVVIQDVDTNDELLAKARIRAYGTTSQAIRRFFHDAVRKLRGGAKKSIDNPV